VGALARVAGRGVAPVVYTEHNVPGGYRRASRWLNAATWRWQAGVVAVSEAVGRGGPAGRARGALAPVVIPNGLDLGALDREAAAPPGPLPPAPAGALRVLVPATLARRKGQDVLLDALGRLAPVGRRFAVWLAGEGPAREALRRRTQRLGLEAAVHLLGRRTDVLALALAADCVVLPSRQEGHPLALLEALALGRPVLACAVGGVPEIVDPGRTGLLVPPEDPAALAAALERLRRDPALRARLGAAAARAARARFDVRRSVAAVEALYRRVLADRREPGVRRAEVPSGPAPPGP
jgi:glycosyltransferase involved in cell wall biosynthesis